MTNPFAIAAPAAPAAPTATDVQANASALGAAQAVIAEVDKAVTTAKPEAPKNLGIGDPFAAPKGIGDGERITDFIDRLLLVKPTEFISQMGTTQGPSDAVRVDMAVLDDPEEPGKVVIGVLLFQQALRREAKAILDGPLPFLLGRLNKGTTGNNNTLYTFVEANEDEVNTARQFLAARPKAL